MKDVYAWAGWTAPENRDRMPGDMDKIPKAEGAGVAYTILCGLCCCFK